MFKSFESSFLQLSSSSLATAKKHVLNKLHLQIHKRITTSLKNCKSQKSLLTHRFKNFWNFWHSLPDAMINLLPVLKPSSTLKGNPPPHKEAVHVSVSGYELRILETILTLKRSSGEVCHPVLLSEETKRKATFVFKSTQIQKRGWV